MFALGDLPARLLITRFGVSCDARLCYRLRSGVPIPMRLDVRLDAHMGPRDRRADERGGNERDRDSLKENDWGPDELERNRERIMGVWTHGYYIDRGTPEQDRL